MPLSMSHRSRAILAVLATLALACALRAPVAHADSTQFSIMQDDDMLLYRGNKTRDQTLAQMKRLGVDVVKVTVLWRNVAQDVERHGFDGANPRDYPRANWDRYDELVKSAQRLHLFVYFDVTGPGPKQFMGHTSNRRIAATYKPNAREFYKFVKAVGTRYDGSYRDENYGRAILPAVHFWSIWNEPNQGGWLSPQYVGGQPYSPRMYRELYLRGHQALTETGHGPKDNLILAGETAPLGSNDHGARSPMRPAKFIRELFCLQPTGQPYTGADATARGCDLFQKFAPQGGWQMSGWAHHPYTKKLAPTARDSNPDSITMANLNGLEGLLDGIANITHLFGAGLPVFLTEFGYESNPPDRFAGIPQSTQAAWMNVGDEIAYRDPRVASVAQFLLRDQPPNRKHPRGSRAYWANYQSGLRTASGKAKPSLLAYSFPFNLTPLPAGPGGAGQYQAWGQLRFRPNFEQGDVVGLQFRPQGGTAWTTKVEVPVTNPVGYFDLPISGAGKGSWRAVLLLQNQPIAGSREIAVGY
jgi:hypothetical protein